MLKEILGLKKVCVKGIHVAAKGSLRKEGLALLLPSLFYWEVRTNIVSKQDVGKWPK